MKSILAFVLLSTLALSDTTPCMGKKLWPAIQKKLSTSNFGDCKKDSSSDHESESYNCDKVKYTMMCTFFSEDIFYLRVADKDAGAAGAGNVSRKFVEDMNDFLMSIVPQHFNVKCDKEEVQKRFYQTHYVCRGAGKNYSLIIPNFEDKGDYLFSFQERKI